MGVDHITRLGSGPLMDVCDPMIGFLVEAGVGRVRGVGVDGTIGCREAMAGFFCFNYPYIIENYSFKGIKYKH